MKKFPTQKAQLIYRREDALTMIQSIWNDPETSFDEFCVTKYEIVMDEDLIGTIKAVYGYLKVTPQGHPSTYWPIQPCEEEINKKHWKEILQKIQPKDLP